MDSYIVRIYRRNHEKDGDVVGLVEKVGGEEERIAFHNMRELSEILSDSSGHARAAGSLMAATRGSK